MMDILCKYPGCNAPRWHGQNGKQNLSYCPEHQRHFWRQQKVSKRERELAAMKEGKPRSSKASLKRGRKAEARKPQRPSPVRKPTITAKPQAVTDLAQLPALEKCVLVDEKKGTITVVWQRKLEDLKQVDPLLELYKADGFEILIDM